MNQHLTQPDNAATPSGEIFEAAFSLKQVGAILGVSRPTVMKLIRTGELTAFRTGTLWKIKPVVLREYMNAKAIASVPAGGSE